MCIFRSPSSGSLGQFRHYGSHCEAEYCNQHDFLPFKCSLCSKTLCLTHRSPVAHSCPASSAQNVTSVDCPVCHQSVKCVGTDDVNVALTKHYTTSCTKQPVQKAQPVHCAAKGCSNKLNTTTTLTCRKCGKKTCISHRLSNHHHCNPTIKSRLVSQFSVPSQKHTSNIFKDSAEVSNMRKGEGATQHQVTPSPPPPTAIPVAVGAPTSSNIPLIPPHSMPCGSIAPYASVVEENEICPQCLRRFADVMDLIAHVEWDHSRVAGKSSEAVEGTTARAYLNAVLAEVQVDSAVSVLCKHMSHRHLHTI